MQKAKNLHAKFIDRFSHLRENPDTLAFFVTNRSTIPEIDDSSYQLNYGLNIYLLNQNIDFIVYETAIMEWLREISPDKFQTFDAREKFMAAQIEILDHEYYNAEITLELSEFVKITKNESGQLIGEYLPPVNFDDPFEGDTNVKNLDDAGLVPALLAQINCHE